MRNKIKTNNSFSKEERIILKSMIDKKYGVITTIKHYRDQDKDQLSVKEDIFNTINEDIGNSTLERLVGLRKPKGTNYRKPNKNTFDIVAEYLGYKSGEILLRVIKQKIKDNREKPEFKLNSLFIEHKVTILFENKKKLIIAYLINQDFEVIYTEGLILEEGDIITISQLEIGYALYCSNVNRPSRKTLLGSYNSNYSNQVKSILFTKD